MTACTTLIGEDEPTGSEVLEAPPADGSVREGTEEPASELPAAEEPASELPAAEEAAPEPPEPESAPPEPPEPESAPPESPAETPAPAEEAPEPAEEPEAHGATLPECDEAGTSNEDAARCLYAAVGAGDAVVAGTVAAPEVVEELLEVSEYEGFALWEFTGCADPLLLDPSTGVSCTYHEPAFGDLPHGVEIEFAMGTRDGQPYVEAAGYVG